MKSKLPYYALLAMLGIAVAAAPNYCGAEKPKTAEEGAARDWKQVLRAWRGAVVMGQRDEGDASRQAKANIRSIADPEAVPAIGEALKNEEDHNVRLLHYRALGNIANEESLELLVDASVQESGKSMRRAACDLISKMPNAEAAAPMYAKYLRNAHHAPVATESLWYSGVTAPRATRHELDPELTKALIAALMIRGEARVPVVLPDDAGWEELAGRVISDGSIPQPATLQNLRRYTGEDFGYDRSAWGKWYRESELSGADRRAAAAAEGDAEPDWPLLLRQWRAAIVMGKREEGEASRQAKENIRNIDDPHAVPAIQTALKGEKDHNVRYLYYQALANIPTEDSLEALVRASVNESGESVRHAVAKLISKMPNRQEAVPLYVRFLRSPQYAGYAAEAVSQSGITSQQSPGEQMDRELVYGLINGLVGVRVEGRLVWAWRFWQGSEGRRYRARYQSGYLPYKVAVPVPNPQALDSLREYTGQNYGYDQDSWKRWYEQEAQAPDVSD